MNDPPLDSQTGLLTVSDISCLIIPDGCVGLPTLAAIEQGIPVIAVKENKNSMQNRLEDFPFANGQLHLVDNYLEAVGVMHAIKAGVPKEAVRRPFCYTTVLGSEETDAAPSLTSDETEGDKTEKRTAVCRQIKRTTFS